MIKSLVISLFVLLLSKLLLAQNEEVRFGRTDIEARSNYTVENITVSDGLHSTNIYDVLQDSLGFLWLASGNGLQKYDGYTFTFYDPDPSDSSLEGVFGLYEDRRKNLWIQRGRGLSRYRRESDDFVAYYFVNSENDTIPYRVVSIAEDSMEGLWAWIQDRGLYRVNLETKKFIPQENVNQWLRDLRKEVVLKETDRKGLYETWITFPPEQYGMKLRYKFAIKRKNGALDWEPNPNPGEPVYGNRELFLTGDTLILPAVQFNSRMSIDQDEEKTFPETDLEPTHVKFSVDLNNLENPLLEGEEIQVRGDIPPLRWQSQFSVSCIVFDAENELWIATDALGLFRFNLETGRYENFLVRQRSSESSGANQINTAIRDQEGDLWVGSNSGLSRFNADEQTFETYFADTSNFLNTINGVHRLKDDEHGNIWTQSHLRNGGVTCFNKGTKKFTHYSTGFGLWFSSITVDRSGIVWLGNEFRGLYKLDPDALKFSTFSIKRGGKDVLEGKIIYSAYEDRTGKIWIGGELDGLYCYDRKTEKGHVYRVSSSSSDSLYSNVVNHIYQDRKGRFWIGTGMGLNRFDPGTGRFKRIAPGSGRSADLTRTSHIYEDIHGMLWLLTREGYLVRMNPDTYESEFFSLYGNSDLDRQMEYCDLIEDPRGFFWIASTNFGLFKFDLEHRELSIVRQIGTASITSVYLDPEGILWCGAVGQGLIRYDTKRDTKTIIGEEDGLLGTSIMGLEADHSGNLWVSSKKGLSRYNPKTGAFEHFFREDGFFTNEFSYQAHAGGRNGELIFGTTHGIVMFQPDSIRESDYIPPIVLSDFKIRNEPVRIDNDSPLKKHISVSDEVVLAHDQNDISITFAALDFTHPERNRYSFFLKDYEEDWRAPGLERTVYYTNLDPGAYTFRVKGTNSDGVWNEKGASIRIIVLPPWWRTGWAYALYVVVLGLILYSVRRFELKRTRLKADLEKQSFESRKLKEIDQMKSRFFADISHEFRTPLTLILGPVQKLLITIEDRERREDVRVMQRNARRLQHLIDQLLDLSRVEARRMPLRAHPGDVVPRIREWTASFVSLADSKNIRLKLHFPERAILVYFDAEKLEKIVYNLLSNAFKFTPEGGEITVAVGSGGSSFELSVRDSGMGIPPDQIPHIFDRFYRASDALTGEQGGTGIGLALTREFVELHHGEIRVESEPGKGSTFTVLLPLGREHLSDEEIVEHVPGGETPGPSPQALEPVDGGAQTVPAEASARAKGGRPRVLIVEDNADMRRYLRNALYEKYEVLEAENGKSGHQAALVKAPELIVSDVMMPGMDGFELCRKLKTDQRTSHIPVVLLTARAGQEDKVEGLETGADDYLTKPFDARELEARVRNLIEQRQRLHDRFRRELLIQPSEITATSMDEAFLQKVMAAVETHMDDPEFDTDDLARASGFSRRQLNRKLRALTGQSVREFIRTIRLKRAAQLLQQQSGTVTEIVYEVGFQNPGHFAKIFREQFGVAPSEYLKKDPAAQT